VVAAWTGVPVGKMRSDQVKAVLELDAKLAERVRGQPEALKVVSEVLRISHAGIRNPATPLGVLQGQACFRKSYKNNRDRAGSITDFRKTKAPSEGEAFG